MYGVNAVIQHMLKEKAARDYIKHNAEHVGNILCMGSQKSSKEKKTMGSVYKVILMTSCHERQKAMDISGQE